MASGEMITRPFNLVMAVPQDCETGLNISARFESNNNAFLDDKYLDMGNGLRASLKRNSTDVKFNDTYEIGHIMPQTPVSIPYTATLSQIPGSSITSGSFSKTIRIVVSY